MTATRKRHSTKRARRQRSGDAKGGVLYLAFELGWNEWKLAFATGPADNPRLRTSAAATTEVLSGDRQGQEAFRSAGRRSGVQLLRGRPRWLLAAPLLGRQGIDNMVVDSSSIEVKRRGGGRKTDRLDAGKLVSMLIRWHQGERKVWSVVQVPSVADEDRRQLHRDFWS